MVLLFSIFTYFGIPDGAATRSPSYPGILELLCARWVYADPAVVADVHAFRMRAILAGMSDYDYQQFMVDVVSPIVNDNQELKTQRLRAALAPMEAAMSSAMSLAFIAIAWASWRGESWAPIAARWLVAIFALGFICLSLLFPIDHSKKVNPLPNSRARP